MPFLSFYGAGQDLIVTVTESIHLSSITVFGATRNYGIETFGYSRLRVLKFIWGI